jgi:hypothetical protein
MAATGIFATAVNAIATRITNLGLVPVTDPRNARPMTVFIELPSFAGMNYNIGDITITLRVLAAPPGNSDAGDYLMTTIDTLMADQGLAIIEGRPTMALIGQQELPAYDLIVRVAVARN